MSSDYENFRTVLTVNLASVLPDAATLGNVLRMVDATMSDFELSRKQMAIIPAAGTPDVVKYYIASKGVSNLSRGTLQQYRYKLEHFFAAVRKSYLDVTANDIRIYLYNFKLERSASDSYVDNVRVTLSAFFRWLTENEYIQRNPCVRVEPIKHAAPQREPLSTLGLESLRVHCETIREKALIDFLYSTGCRVSECAALQKTDIDWSQNAVLIRHGKGDKARVVYFNDESSVSLRAYLSARTDSTPALWVSQKAPHGQLLPHALEAIVRKVGKRAGIHAYPHRLRHTFATVGLRNGIPLDKVQALLGHSDPKTTLIYAKQDTTQLRLEHLKAFS